MQVDTDSIGYNVVSVKLFSILDICQLANYALAIIDSKNTKSIIGETK